MKSYVNFKRSEISSTIGRPLIRLLGHDDGIEVIQFELRKGNIFFLKPSLSNDTYEFYFINKGKLKHQDDVYEVNDYFETFNNDEMVKLTAMEDTVILYISSKDGEFHDADGFNTDLVEQLDAIQTKDHYTYEHCKRVKRLVNEIIENLEMDYEDQKNILVAAYFHDVGKIKIPDHILNKPGRLTEAEFDDMRQHVTYSHDIIASTLGQDIADIIIMHHERLDGSGYPKGLRDIPLAGRILGVVDSYDAMTSKRVYQMAKTHEEAIKELLTMTDKYDEKIIKLIDQIKRNHAEA